MGTPLINSLKAEETFFLLLLKIQKQIKAFDNDLCKWNFFSYIFQTAQGTQLSQTLGFVARMGILQFACH